MIDDTAAAPRRTHEVLVYAFTLDAETNENCLSADEVARGERFVFARDRNRYRVGRARLRGILADLAGADPASLQFSYNAFGKPALVAPGPTGLQFNLSHTAGAALLAVSATIELGIDLEAIREFSEEMPASVFSHREQDQLRALPHQRRNHAFFNCWTRKEAFVKACGPGLSMPLDDFDVTLTGAPRVTRIAGAANEHRRWQMRHIEGVGDDLALLVGALAVEAGQDAIRVELKGSEFPVALR
ncbi:MAG: 4'-phosphopantetheinyl transferase superfamily protein [Pseudomonadota bacterium]